MPADVLVRHCTLTVRGRGGWGWGTDCAGYLAAAIPAIEQALEQVLRDCELDPTTEVRIEEPVFVTWLRDGTMPDEVRQALVEMIRGEAEKARPALAPSDGVDPMPRPQPASAGPPAPGPAARGLDGADTVAELLAAWSRSGRLRQIVASWPVAVVLRWLDTLRMSAEGSERTEVAAPACESIAELVLADEQWPGGQRRVADQLLVLLGALLAAAGNRPVGPATFEHATYLVRSAAARDGAPPDPLPEAAARSAETHRQAAEATAPPARTLALGPLQRSVAPGLPFLVVVQLSRIGYLDALAAVAQAAGVPAAAQVVAAGVAGKVLPPPERGWRRYRAEAEAVAAASGVPPGEADSIAHALQTDAELMIPPLESALAALYAAGRSAADEVVVTATADGAVCGEAEGALPIAWLPDLDGLDPVLNQLGRPPLRHTDLFAPLARELAARSACPNLEVPALERHAGAVAGTALGSLAQELWGTGVANAPLLALERFADLEVELRPGDVLAVAIPRGQRWLDLSRAGLLDRWEIPWAQGGYWELVSW